MRVTMITLGTRGDVQPYVALGLGLQRAGHAVSIATHTEFETLIRTRGLVFLPVESNMLDQMEAHGVSPNVCTGTSISTPRYLRTLGALMYRHMADCWKACQGTDVIVSSLDAFFVSYMIAQKLGVPWCRADLLPMSPTGAFPSAFVWGDPRFGRAYNWLTHVAIRQIGWQLWRRSVNRAGRAILNLPPIPIVGPFREIQRHRHLVLYGYSAAVVPRPHDWGRWLHVTGYWFLDRPADWVPPVALVEFLAAGPAPVYVGFGSMNRTNRAPTELARLVLQALARTKQRGILSLGCEDIRDLGVPDNVFTIESVPHDWLFPRVAAVVHHGGAGTTAASLRAGVPSIIVPFFGDQPFWGSRVYELGVGPKPIPRERLSVDRLAHAISVALGDAEMRARAAVLGGVIGAENGVARAVEIVQHHLCPGA